MGFLVFDIWVAGTDQTEVVNVLEQGLVEIIEQHRSKKRQPRHDTI